MKIAMGVEYNGYAYHGWQSQAGLSTVQAALESAITRVAAHPVQTICAGRTDACVHAYGQIVHFETDVIRSERAWLMGTNANLPPDIAIRWVQPVLDEFHARFSATARRYRYVIYNHPVRSAISRHHMTWYCRPLDAPLMQTAANVFLGKHDFTSLRSSACQAKTAIRCIEHFTVAREGELVILDIKANAFLHHMVRNLAGVLLPIGAGLKSVSWAQEALEAQDRRKAGVTAPPYGLYLTQVYYPEKFQLQGCPIKIPA